MRSSSTCWAHTRHHCEVYRAPVTEGLLRVQQQSVGLRELSRKSSQGSVFEVFPSLIHRKSSLIVHARIFVILNPALLRHFCVDRTAIATIPAPEILLIPTSDFKGRPLQCGVASASRFLSLSPSVPLFSPHDPRPPVPLFSPHDPRRR